MPNHAYMFLMETAYEGMSLISDRVLKLLLEPQITVFIYYDVCCYLTWPGHPCIK